MAIKCKTIKGREICPRPNLFSAGYLGRQPFVEGFSSEAQAVFDLMDTDPPTALKIIMATAIDEMVTDGNFAELGQLLVVLDTSANSLIDWMGNQNAIAVNSPVFDAFDFWEFDGATNYVDTQMANNANPAMSQNSIDAGAFVVSHDTPSGTEMIFGRTTGGEHQIFSNGAVIGYAANTTGNTTDATEGSFASNSLYSVRRVESANHLLFKNGVQVDTGARASVALLALDNFWGARNAGAAANFWGGKMALYYAGSGVINNLNLFNTLNTMITDIAALG